LLRISNRISEIEDFKARKRLPEILKNGRFFLKQMRWPCVERAGRRRRGKEEEQEGEERKGSSAQKLLNIQVKCGLLKTCKYKSTRQ
jgi:hypothetical protein